MEVIRMINLEEESDDKKEAQNGNPMLLVKVLNHPLTFKKIITETTKGVKE